MVGRVMAAIENRVVVSMKPALRYAVAENCGGMAGGPEVRLLVIEALQARGWSPERMVGEYGKYVAECYRSGKENEFESSAAAAVA
jgi:hypothetical protein